jgi:hypothetical protein
VRCLRPLLKFTMLIQIDPRRNTEYVRLAFAIMQCLLSFGSMITNMRSFPQLRNSFEMIRGSSCGWHSSLNVQLVVPFQLALSLSAFQLALSLCGGAAPRLRFRLLGPFCFRSQSSLVLFLLADLRICSHCRHVRLKHLPLLDIRGYSIDGNFFPRCMFYSFLLISG